ncbi:putative disease resistance RPP13-like protein 1 [Vitis vinifera]|uniref:Putative disease resistance RPP13-like protein 1 n=1 Tax=Vitis vinifera TaxID=29760 RepID=A0A438J6J6_VITVI|nr:putative disease resistance RPP13-like protein 1 [Vitis vinifera]
MEITLLTVYTVLNDAEVKQITNPPVTKWVEELKHVVYEAEDLLDEIATEALRCKMESDSQTSATQVWSIISTSLDSFGEGIESKVEGIIDRLEFLAQQKDVLGLKEGVGEKRSQRWPSASLVDESGVYGRGGSKEEIIEFLLCDNQRGNEACVISIVGMGGLGKTTLSQLVYNDERVDTHFDLKSWDPNLLQVRLKESLNGKKFLLVLDDVWNENYNNWDLLHTPLKAGFKGSKIIVTTRSEKVALIMRATRIHHLGQLPFEDCWSIFAKHAFGSGDSSLHPKLEAIGKEIVGKCNGSPLAAKILGGILYCKVAEEEWENILNSEMWKLPTNEIFSSLRLSYYYLPSHLKRCFAYCSIFPKSYEFQKEKLILLWMAEGFLQEPIARKEKKGSLNWRKWEIRCFSLIELPVGMGKLINLRHLDITDTKVTKMPADIGQLKSLQTLSTFMVGQGDRDALEANLKDKRYLDELLLQWNHSTDGVLQHGTDILNKLQPHTNLKRLSINCFGGTRFPDWLGDFSFFNIVTLHLYKWVGSEFYGNDYLPGKPFTSLETLRFEDLPEWKRWLSFRGEGGEFPRLQEFYIQNCPKLTGDLPVQLPSLIKLEIKGCNQLLVSLPRFPAIRKLKMLKCGNGLSQITYSGFTSLESLVVSDISQLKELPPGLRWLSINNCESVESPLERMLQSNTHLQYLKIKNCSFSRFLKRGGLPTTLKSVSIYNSKKLEFLLQEFLKCHHPFLERLSIHVGTCNSLSSFSFGFFPRLTHVEISYLEGLESLLITIPEADLTSLQWMFIRGCPNLVSIGLPALDSSCPLLASSQQSVGHALSSLQTLTLHDCPELLFPREGFPSNLRSLEIHNCNKLSLQEDWGLQRYSSLTHFRISGGCEGLETFPKDCLLPSNLTSLQISRLPDLKSLDNNGLKPLLFLKFMGRLVPQASIIGRTGFEHLTSLKELRISDCASLQSLTQVGLQHLNCLRRLCISGCHKLQCLTEERLPASLSFLEIRYCPLLKRRCKFREGQDWHYISHIPCIVIDDQAFLMNFMLQRFRARYLFHAQ